MSQLDPDQWKGVKISEVYSPDTIHMFQIIQSKNPTFKKSGKVTGISRLRNPETLII